MVDVNEIFAMLPLNPQHLKPSYLFSIIFEIVGNSFNTVERRWNLVSNLLTFHLTFNGIPFTYIEQEIVFHTVI